MANPLSRRQVLKYGAFTTVGGVLTPGVSLAQAIVADTYKKEAAEDAWKRCVAFFDKHLKG